MVNFKRISAGILGAGAGLLVMMDAQAGIPTLDASNIAGTFGIVKNGAENIKGIGEVTNKVGELNTIVGDAAASVSKFQADYGDEINKGIEVAQKAMARKAEADAAKAQHDAELQAQKDAYQAALDSIETPANENPEDIEEFEEEPAYEDPQIADEAVYGDVGENMQEEAEEVTPPVMTSSGRDYDDSGDFGGENLDGVPGDGENLDGVPGEIDGEAIPENGTDEENLIEVDENGLPIQKPAAVVMPAEGVTIGDEPIEGSLPMRRTFRRPAVAGSVATSTGSTAVRATVPAATREAVAPAAVRATVPAATREAVAPAVSATEAVSTTPAATTGQRRQFRVSPRLNRVNSVEKISSSNYRHSETMAFASSSDSEGIGNSYIGDVYVVPMAERCSISAETFIKNEDKRKECIETIIRENNADNSFDSALSMKDCRRMVYKAVVALLAEATNSKYEAANYSDTLDEQDKLAADSTDVRGDLTVLAMSNYQTQLLLNRISMSFSSQIILDTVEQLCAANKDVLGDSDMDKASETSGEK